jgi:hypothetical protein
VILVVLPRDVLMYLSVQEKSHGVVSGDCCLMRVMVEVMLMLGMLILEIEGPRKMMDESK